MASMPPVEGKRLMRRVTSWLTVAVAALLFAPVAAVPAGASPVPTAAADPSVAGAYPVGYVDAAVSAAGRSFNARVYYPATAAGNAAPVAGGAFPAVAFGHGFFQQISKYASTGAHLASWGMITILPTSQGGLFPSHGGFADDLNAALTWIVAQNAASGGRFVGHVRTDRLGLSGHSMGGGASLLAAARNPAVRTVANLAAAETNPSAVAAAGTIAAPVLLLAGDDDTITPIAEHQRLMYDAKRAPAQLRTIAGGFHCGFVDSNGIGCDSGALSREAQLKLTRKVLTSWFLYYLAGDTSMQDLVWGTAARTDPQVAFEGRN